MNFSELFDYKDVEFLGLTEPDVNELRLFFHICKVSDVAEDFVLGQHIIKNTYPIIINKELPIIQIDFKICK